jgi:hypothetical protein
MSTTNILQYLKDLKSNSQLKKTRGHVDHPSLARAYPDCNQYLTGQSGIATSYNWPSIQLSSKAHNICIRRELGKREDFLFLYLITSYLFYKIFSYEKADKS